MGTIKGRKFPGGSVAFFFSRWNLVLEDLGLFIV
jgi:hypothetical protein